MKKAVAFFVTLILLVMVNSSLANKETLQPSDLPAYMWMQSPKADRDVYVLGFLGGMNQTVRVFNKEIIFKRYIKYAEVSEKLYMHLLAHPELRNGPIGLIILDALKEVYDNKKSLINRRWARNPRKGKTMETKCPQCEKLLRISMECYRV